MLRYLRFYICITSENSFMSNSLFVDVVYGKLIIQRCSGILNIVYFVKLETFKCYTFTRHVLS